MNIQGGLVIIAICLVVSLQAFMVNRLWDMHADVAQIQALLESHAGALHHDAAEGIVGEFYGMKDRIQLLEEHTAGHLHEEGDE